MNQDKILILSHPRSGTSMLYRKAEQAFAMKYEYNISLDYTYTGEVLNPAHGNRDRARVRNDFFKLLETDCYVIKYFMFMDEMLPTDELIDVIKKEEMSVYYLRRKSVSDVIVSTVNAFINVWPHPELTPEEINTRALDLVITDAHILKS